MGLNTGAQTNTASQLLSPTKCYTNVMPNRGTPIYRGRAAISEASE